MPQHAATAFSSELSLTLPVPLIHRMSRSLAAVLHGPDLRECRAGEAEHAIWAVSGALRRAMANQVRTLSTPRRGLQKISINCTRGMPAMVDVLNASNGTPMAALPPL